MVKEKFNPFDYLSFLEFCELFFIISYDKELAKIIVSNFTLLLIESYEYELTEK